jgi:hypothetical protein
MENNYSEKVDLVDFIKIIFKNKIVILFFIIFGVLFSCFYVFLSTINTAETIIQIGSIGKDPLENQTQLINKINIGFYGEFSGLKASSYPETNLIKLDISSRDKNEAIKNLKSIVGFILAEHNNAVDNKIKTAEDKNDQLMNSVKYSSGQIILLQDNQGYSDSFEKTKVIKDAEILPETGILNKLVKIMLGGLLGFFLGMMWVFSKIWYKKNII